MSLTFGHPFSWVSRLLGLLFESCFGIPALKAVIQDYALKTGITLKAKYEGENLPAAMSLVTSTGGITLTLPLSAPDTTERQRTLAHRSYL